MTGIKIRLKKFQRIYIGPLYIETQIKSGSVEVFVAGPNPFPDECQVVRETSGEYKQRLGGQREKIK